MGKSVWEWLEIEPTTDINIIKAAYAEASMKYHPAEHPDEFKQLRECYKSAIKIAKSRAEYGKEAFRESFYSGEGDSEFAEKYEFNISKERTILEEENTDISKYDYSSVAYDDSLSGRQIRMLDLFSRMLSFVRMEPTRFGHENVIGTIMYNWDKAPYKEEITPTFIEYVLDSMEDCGALSIGAVSAIEKIIFADISDSQTEILHSRFRSVCANINNITDCDAELSAEDVKKCFCRLLDYSSYEIQRGISFGKDTPYNKKTKILPIKEILLFYDDKAVRYYFCEEISYAIDSKTDNLTIYDHDNNMILKIKSNNKNYVYLLDHIIKNGSRNIGEKSANIDFFEGFSYITRLYRLSELWKRALWGFIFSCLTLLVCFLIIVIFSGVSFWLQGLGRDNKIISYISLIFIFVTFVIVFASLCVAIAGMGYGAGYSIFLCDLILKKELRRDIKNGQAVSVLNNDLYIFKNYIIYMHNYFYSIIPFKNILSLEVYNDSAPKLKLTCKNGTKQFISIFPFDAIHEVVAIVNEWKKEESTQREELIKEKEKLYVPIRGLGLFRWRLFFIQDFWGMPWGTVIFSLIAFGVNYAVIQGIHSGELVVGRAETWIVLVLTMLVELIEVLYIIQFFALYKIPADKILGAHEQMLKENCYRNEENKIYVSDDYFVSLETFNPFIIRYDEMLSIRKSVPKNIEVLLIELKDGRRYEFCGGKEDLIDEVLTKVSEKLNLAN